ncbi:MAG: MFS transporter [Spirochaetaceae bacterium]|nr:MAG: MFS transporter [Spirochaetaceae bacterium]
MSPPKRTTSRALSTGIRANISTILLLVAVLFFVFVARVIYSPLLPAIERDLHLNHTQAASFFLFITLGYTVMNLLSGFVASWLGHRSTVFIAALLVILASVFIAASSSLLLIRVGLVFVGVGAGLYPPSGIAMVSSLVDSKDEGKVLSIHEAGPNLGFIVAPLIVALILPRLNWRSCLVVVSLLGLVLGMLFMIFSRGGSFKGEAPVLRNATQILSLPSFWIATVLLALGAGASIGLYSIIPTYLVFERGLGQELVNTIVGISRISGLIALFFAGFLVDRFGAKRIISVILLSAGLATVAFWVRSRPILLAAVFLQPIFIVSFFPAFLTAIARIAPRRLQNLTISFALPLGYGFGGGILPVVLGWLGDHATFAIGFLLYGLILIAGSGLPFLLALKDTG